MSDEVQALPGPAVDPLSCPLCTGEAELNGSGGITCFFCGYDGPAQAWEVTVLGLPYVMDAFGNVLE